MSHLFICCQSSGDGPNGIFQPVHADQCHIQQGQFGLHCNAVISCRVYRIPCLSARHVFTRWRHGFGRRCGVWPTCYGYTGAHVYDEFWWSSQHVELVRAWKCHRTPAQWSWYSTLRKSVIHSPASMAADEIVSVFYRLFVLAENAFGIALNYGYMWNEIILK